LQLLPLLLPLVALTAPVTVTVTVTVVVVDKVVAAAFRFLAVGEAALPTPNENRTMLMLEVCSHLVLELFSF
jgi:hypothetical protein